ncbi:Multicopper oxidase, type 1 [Corchorus capsularis]|uniref:Multicopper oxidase, type 1 n=1 Tax=Corchorus capsularis TaxID=210143 RepID=A0A1R3GF87_COCAP|nr:Multicopper oxidase, type 1 [Corchorus capsularis]
MGKAVMLHLLIGVLAVLSVFNSNVNAEDPYLFYTWTVTYGTRSILGVPQQVILINGQFPGPKLEVVTNNNIILNLINKLDQPFLLTWNGVKQRKNSWQDGVLGTNCPIPPNSNYTYKFQAKDQIGTYTYFPSTLFHKAAGGFGALNIIHRSVIPIPYAPPAGDFTLLIGDWYKTSHKTLQQTLDSGKSLPFPDGVLINGQTQNTFTGDQGKTYMFRISNVGLSTSLNFRIQGHTMKLVEVEGSHVIQNMYDSLDVHVGQSVTVLVTLNQQPKDYYIVASTRFTRNVLTATAVLHYSNSQAAVSGPLPVAPVSGFHWSMQQARTYRWNLTSNAARPNPQGSFHYGMIKPTKTIVLANSASLINGKLRYAVNGVSYINPDTPLKLADYFNIPGVFSMNALQSVPSGGAATVASSVMPTSLHDFLEVVFQNNENTMQSWHLDGYDFWVVGFGSGQWSPQKRKTYNLVDALTRHTTQVYPNSWTTILVSLDNQGMWNMSVFCANAEDPYRYYNWVVTYGTRNPLGVYQKVILINNQFPGPTIEAVTNDNIIVNVINQLDEPFLITWHGIKQRRTSWQDGVLGTNCPIPPHSNWTYKFQLKDQIGTYMYYPSTLLHRAAGGFGAINVNQRSVISIPYPAPAGEFTLLVGDWYKSDSKALQKTLDSGLSLPQPDGLLINGLHQSAIFTGQQGKTYKFRITNVGISTSINFRIQGHTMILIEVEGSHTLQEAYESIDIHAGQSVAVLVTLRAHVPKNYYIVASSRFTKPVLTTFGILQYEGSKTQASPPLPIGPTYQIHWSMKQARTIRLNLTANAARPNPQGSFHYGAIKVVRTLVLANTKTKINGKLRYAVNGVSYVDPTTPLKLADWFNIPGVFKLNSTKDTPVPGPAVLGVSVYGITLHDYVEIIFQNTEAAIQSWHLDGSSFYVVGYGSGTWIPKLRKKYNLADAVSRHTVQVYPASWTAVMVSLDNKGMWNLRSQIWERRYLGQQVYLRVWNDEKSLYTETDIPPNALRCGKAK